MLSKTQEFLAPEGRILDSSYVDSLNTTFESKFNTKMVTIPKIRIIYFYFQKLTERPRPSLSPRSLASAVEKRRDALVVVPISDEKKNTSHLPDGFFQNF